ncbi:DUF1697 domain-containing protein [Paludisphaera soli]|uniref:DUF1697 domain-containing protein n=1 Tax=Paludisphaera soli TaxID=2712865 RepID=UPI0013EE0F5B|nr:DUF1697 domain-containing protein [Paludisphaera soli]
MQRYIALLGGINVGGRRIKMGDLARSFEALGLVEVQTFIASGNVAFETPTADPVALERTIEGHLAGALGYAVPTFLRTPDELAAAATRRPFASEGPEAAGFTVSVCFLRRSLTPEEVEGLLSYRTAMDDFEVVGREMYWLCRGKVTESLVPWHQVAKSVMVPSTVRNVTTVRKLAAKYPPA